MLKLQNSISGLLALTLTACGTIGLKSEPWVRYSPLLDTKAVNFMQNVPQVTPHTDTSYDDDGFVIALSVAGGGTRASAFTLGVLDELEELGLTLPNGEQKNLLESIDFVSANSGGAWGIAAYIADRLDHGGATNYKIDQRRDSDIIPRFIDNTGGSIPDWASMFSEEITLNKTFGDLASSQQPLPEFFVNATILPAQVPFVFTQDYIDYYQIEQFGSNKWTSEEWQTEWNDRQSLDDVPIGYAASISGSVPPWYYGYANTRVCMDAELKPSSFCNDYLGKNGQMNGLHIVDGGLYDNFGMNTVVELMSGLNNTPETKRAIIFIDTTTSIQPHFDANVEGWLTKYSKAKGFRDSMGFPARDAIYNRLREPFFSALEAETVVLDLYSTANFDIEKDEHLIDDLTELEDYARAHVSCFSDDREVLRAHNTWLERLTFQNESARTQSDRNGSADCLANNYYRTGTAMKTSYFADELLFTVTWQLGQLAVRMNQEKIKSALEGQ